MKNFIKKATALFLALSISLSGGIFSFVVNAATSSVSDSYQSFGYNMGGSGLGAYYGQFIFLTAGGKIGYCVEINKNGSSATYTLNSDDKYRECIAALGLSVAQGKNLEYALVHGYQDTSKYGYNAVEERVATQIIVWAIVNGWYDSSTSGISASELTAIKYLTGKVKGTSAYSSTRYTSLEESGAGTYDNVRACYALIKKNIVNFNTKPSYDRATYEMAYNPATHKYSVTITDVNATSALYDWADAISDIDGLTVSVLSPTKITFTSTKIINGEEIKAEKVKGYGYTSGVTIQNTNIAYLEAPAGNDQDAIVPFETDDPVSTRITLNASTPPTGNLYIIKTSDDGNVNGVSFSVTGSDGSSATVSTNAAGVATVADLPSADDDGESITYTIAEVNVSDIYVAPAAQQVTLEDGVTKVVNFENALKMWRASVTKRDSATGGATGAATLADAVYGLYHNGSLVTTYTTDANGCFTTDYYPCGSYTISEISPSTGYLLSPTGYSVGSTASCTAAYNTLGVTVTEQIIKGYVAITKTAHTDPCYAYENGNDEPEDGAEFEVYLQSAGSYDAAAASCRAIITTNDTGYGISTALSYGTYTIHQTKSAEGYWALEDDITVVISENGKTYSYELSNEAITSELEIYKVDEDGAPISGSRTNAQFKIYCVASADWVTMDGSDVYECDDEGHIHLPEALLYGAYELHELTAPYLYYNDGVAVPFEVTGAEEVITIEKVNKKQKGNILLTKQCSTFTSVATTTEAGTEIYTPEFELTNDGTGAEYTLYVGSVPQKYLEADGSLKEGTDLTALGYQRVGTYRINADGYLITELLPIQCSYFMLETKAPEGYAINRKPIQLRLTYAGQNVEFYTTRLSDVDVQQTVEVSIKKSFEADDGTAYKNTSFALYAAEEIEAPDGSYIPQDGLIEIAGVDKNGTASFSVPLPYGSYYVKEYATDWRYIAAEETYPFTVTYDENTEAVTRIVLNDGAEVENVLRRTTITGRKINEISGELLAGATFGLFPTSATSFSEETALATSTSAEDGTFSFADVPLGEYYVVELVAPEGYRLLDAPIYVNATDYLPSFTIGDVANNSLKIPPEETPLANPPTGDALNGVVGVMILAGAVAVISAKRKK